MGSGPGEDRSPLLVSHAAVAPENRQRIVRHCIVKGDQPTNVTEAERRTGVEFSSNLEQNISCKSKFRFAFEDICVLSTGSQFVTEDVCRYNVYPRASFSDVVYRLWEREHYGH